MTDISVSSEAMENLFGKVLPHVDGIDEKLGAIPSAPDGGIATELIGFTMAAAADAAGVAADSYRALIAVARDVIEDFGTNDTAAAEELRTLHDQVVEGS